MPDARPHTLKLRSLEGVLSMGRVTLKKRDLAMDLFAFAGTVACAAVFRWRAGDVIWALWISSLCVGFTTIVLTVRRSISTVSGRGPRVLAVIGAAAAIAFFTVHFGGFHFVHAMILNVFFPLVEESTGSSGPAAALAATDAAVPGLFLLVVVTLSRYWPLVVASFLSRFTDLVPGEESSSQDGIGGVYGNVMRMHLLIFVFAGLDALELSRLAIIPVLAAYFFPWKAVLAQLSR